jgi:eukaryotic translation initiation factor 2-alpha kinase 4
LVAGHPKVSKAAVFDIITPDLLTGHLAAGAEVLAITNECLNSFPTLAENYEIHVSDSRSEIRNHFSVWQMLTILLVIDIALKRIPDTIRESVIETYQSKLTSLQKRGLWLKKGLLRSTADELEALAEIGGLFSRFFSRVSVERREYGPQTRTLMLSCLNWIRSHQV